MPPPRTAPGKHRGGPRPQETPRHGGNSPPRASSRRGDWHPPGRIRRTERSGTKVGGTGSLGGASSGYQRSRDGPAKARRRNAVLDAGSRHAGLDGVGDDLLSNLGPYPSCRSGAERQTEVARRATHGDASRRIASRVQLEGELLVLETMETNGGGEDP